MASKNKPMLLLILLLVLPLPLLLMKSCNVIPRAANIVDCKRWELRETREEGVLLACERACFNFEKWRKKFH
jgi:hypothetical protein